MEVDFQNKIIKTAKEVFCTEIVARVIVIMLESAFIWSGSVMPAERHILWRLNPQGIQTGNIN